MRVHTIGMLTVAVLVTNCAHLGGGNFVSQAARVKNELPNGMNIPTPSENSIDDTYMQSKADYHFTMAESYSLQEESTKAVENYKLALVYDAESAQIRYRLALEYVKLGLVSEAMGQCHEALQKDQKHKDAALLLGGLLSATHLYDQALEIYKQTLVYYPEDLETMLFIGAIHAEKGEFSAAIQHFLKMTKNKKIQDQSQIWYYLGRVYASQEKPDYKNAEAAYVTSLKIKPDALDVVMALGALYEVQNQTAQLQKLYAQYQKEYGSQPLLAERLAQIYLNQDQLDLALRELKVVESHDGRNLNISLKIALLLIEQKKYEEAVRRLETLLARTPESEKVRFYLGALYEEMNNYRAAVQQFESIPFGSSYYEDSIMHASYLHKLLGDNDAAIAKIKDGLYHRKDNSKFWLMHASLLDESNRLPEARDVLVSAVAKFPEDQQLHFQLGSVYDRLGQKDKTIEQLKTVLGLDANHVQALNYLAYLYAEGSTELGTAEKLVRKALTLQPGDGFIMDTLGWVLFKQERIAEAVQMLEKAHQKEAKESIIAEHLADAYFRHQLHQKAKEMYKKAADLEKDVQNRLKIQSKIETIEAKIQAELERRKNRTPASY